MRGHRFKSPTASRSGCASACWRSPGARLGDIRRVASHPQALAQCSQWIEPRGWELLARTSTSSAARQLSEDRDPACAVIASAAAGRIYGLTVLAEGIEDDPENTTRFAVLRRTV